MLRLLRGSFFLALLMACLFFCGCATLPSSGEVQGSQTEDTNPYTAPPPTPNASVGNPVWLFYQDFYSSVQAPLDELHGALAKSNDPEALNGELLLGALEERLTEGMVTFGLLMSSDSSSSEVYASYVAGAATGNGTITADGISYDLAFTYTDGTSLKGTLTPYRLRYSRQEPEKPTSYSMLLLRAHQGWAAVLDLGGGPAYVLRSSGDETGLYAIGYSQPQQSPAPTPDSKLITYSTCIEGALQSWVLIDGSLAIASGE